MEVMMLVASWNVNSIRARFEHVRQWLVDRKADVLFLQELKGSEFPTAAFDELGYHSVAVTQKAYNGVAILSRTPIELVSKTLLGDELDSHARFLEVMIEGIRLVNIYLPNGKVKALTGLSKSSLYELIRDNNFPAPIHLGPRTVAWVSSEVRQWAAERISASRAALPHQGVRRMPQRAIGESWGTSKKYA
jgi:predicted DNA-binding transcriptional regulator AlpA